MGVRSAGRGQTDSARPYRTGFALAWPILLLAVVLVVLYVVRRQPPAPAPAGIESAPASAPAPLPVRSLVVRAADEAQEIEVTGTVKADLTTDIAPKIMGRVAAIDAREGDRVRAGQTLVRLESADLEAQVHQAEAALAAAKQAMAQAQTGLIIQRIESATRVEQAGAALRAAQEQLSLVREGARRQQKAQADAAMRQADAALRTAQATYDRYKPLYDEGVIARQRLDEVALALDTARAQYDSAKEQVSLLDEGARTQEIRQAEEGVNQAEEGLRMARAATGETQIKAANVRMLRAQAAQAEAALAAARVTLSYAVLRAPFAGVVIRRSADPGAMASPGAPILTLTDAAGFRLEALVPESELKGIRLGQPARVTLDALGRDLPGRVSQIVPNADPASRTFVVKVALPDRPGLSNGLFGRMHLPRGRRRGIFVPRSALVQRESLTSVLVVEDGTAHQRLITTGRAEGDRVEVLSGLEPGERIIAGDADRIPDGAAVREGGRTS